MDKYNIPVVLIRKETWEIEVNATDRKAALEAAQWAVHKMSPAEMKAMIDHYAPDQVPELIINVEMVQEYNCTSWDYGDVEIVELVNEYKEIDNYDSSQLMDYIQRMKEVLEGTLG